MRASGSSSRRGCHRDRSAGRAEGASRRDEDRSRHDLPGRGRDRKFADLPEREAEWRSAWPGFRVVQRWGDTQAKSARLDFIAKGLDVKPASRDVLGTLREIQELVGDGLFAIDLVRGDLACSQLEAWRFGPGGVKPLEGHDKFDDLCDALRYGLFGIKFIERQQGQHAASITGASETPYRPQTAAGMTTRQTIPGYHSAGKRHERPDDQLCDSEETCSPKASRKSSGRRTGTSRLARVSAGAWSVRRAAAGERAGARRSGHARASRASREGKRMIEDDRPNLHDPLEARRALDAIEAMLGDEIRAALHDGSMDAWLADDDLRFACLTIVYDLAWSDDDAERGRGIRLLMKLAECEERLRGRERAQEERDETGKRVREIAVGLADRKQLGRIQIVDLADELLNIAADVVLPRRERKEA